MTAWPPQNETRHWAVPGFAELNGLDGLFNAKMLSTTISVKSVG